MIKRKLFGRSLLLLMGATLFFSCQKSDFDTKQDTSDEGSVYLSLSLDNATYDIEVQSTKADESSLTAQDFAISLENTKGEVLVQWESFADCPDSFEMVFGSYKFIASYGDSTALPAFESPIYGAESKFTLSEEIPELEVTLDCAPLVTKIEFSFDESFDYSYASYEIAAKTTGDSLHHTAADFGRDGYYIPGDLRLMLFLTPLTNPDTTYLYYYDTDITTSEAEYYHVKLKAVNSSGDLGLNITLNDQTQDYTISQGVPDFWLPQAAPEVTSHTFGDELSVQTTWASQVESEVSMKCYAGVESLVISTTSQELLDMGFPSEGLNLVGASSDDASAAAAEILRGLGVIWNSGLDDTYTASMIKSNTDLVISFTEMSMYLEEQGVHNFTIEMTDCLDQQMESFSFGIEVLPLSFEIMPIAETDVWATFADASINFHVDRPIDVSPELQVSSDGGQNWYSYESTTSQPSDDMYDMNISGLSPATEYLFRVFIDDQTILQADGTYTTEVATQIPNGDMEGWQIETESGKIFGGSSHTLARYIPWSSSSSQHWATINDKTTWYYYLASSSRNYYTWASSTVYTTTTRSGSSGSKAAEIRSISANIGYTPVNSSGSVNASSNAVQGRLFIGDYSYSISYLATAGNGTDTYSYGRTLESRPLQMKFWYQYLPYGTDEFKAYIKVWNETDGTTTQLGYGEFSLSTSSTMSSYVEQTIDIAYSVTNLKATHYTVEFVSSTNSSPSVAENVTIDYAGSPSSSLKGHIGSKLRIDDITLEY